ncbi:MAG: hypothetical protein JWP52_4150 [Rhizobacter sp.]|nr:hypothetical protein [Rhizobacter sp.]
MNRKVRRARGARSGQHTHEISRSHDAADLGRTEWFRQGSAHGQREWDLDSETQTLATLRTARGDYRPAALGLHANEKTVGAGAADLGRLVSTFHVNSSMTDEHFRPEERSRVRRGVISAGRPRPWWFPLWQPVWQPDLATVLWKPERAARSLFPPCRSSPDVQRFLPTQPACLLSAACRLFGPLFPDPLFPNRFRRLTPKALPSFQQCLRPRKGRAFFLASRRSGETRYYTKTTHPGQRLDDHSVSTPSCQSFPNCG